VDMLLIAPIFICIHDTPFRGFYVISYRVDRYACFMLGNSAA
jgi:hypothetical protein